LISLKKRAAVLALATSLLVSYAGAADRYPSRPVRLIVPQAPGSSNDTVSRIVAARFSQLLGQQLIVDNRAGATGMLGAELAARAAPDGYTLLAGSSPTHALAPITYKKLPYDPIRDFAPVSLWYVADVLLCVNPGLPVRSVREFIGYAKARPNELNMASAGLGSVAHLGELMFTSMAGITSTHVPYKNGAANIIAVVGGEAHWLISPVSALMGQVRAGRLRPLAIGNKERSSFLPDLPTLHESGVAGYEYYAWVGLMAPAGTPRALVDRLHAITLKALSSPEVKEQYAAQGVEPRWSASPEAFAQFIADEQQKMRALAKGAGLKPE
jgi:tripartite-type tricarboxylate transporter receptor subunit TctC